LSLAITTGAGIFSREWAVVLELPLKQLATTERTHQIALRAVRQDFQNEISRLETKLRLMQLQLNQRVFFGANASVHMGVKKLCSITTEHAVKRQAGVQIAGCDTLKQYFDYPEENFEVFFLLP
jgi:hypothetical protein